MVANNSWIALSNNINAKLYYKIQGKLLFITLTIQGQGQSPNLSGWNTIATIPGIKLDLSPGYSGLPLTQSLMTGTSNMVVSAVIGPSGEVNICLGSSSNYVICYGCFLLK